MPQHPNRAWFSDIDCFLLVKRAKTASTSTSAYVSLVPVAGSLLMMHQWEDPIRTLSSYVVILSLLTGFHMMPLTLWSLKAGAYTFGGTTATLWPRMHSLTWTAAVSVAEFVSRSFGPDTFLSRLRPKPYREVPERILNATLKDIHDFTQYSVVQGQKVMFGQDLGKTFAVSNSSGEARLGTDTRRLSSLALRSTGSSKSPPHSPCPCWP
jgi:hypothetical protein